MSAFRLVISGVLATLILMGLAWGSLALYRQFDQQIYRFVESHPTLRGFRNYLRLWPHPSDYLSCEAVASSPIPRFEAASAIVNGKLYVFGGFIDRRLRADGRSDFFDPNTGNWAQISSLPAVVTHAGVAAANDEVWLVGGFAGDHPGPATSDVWVYDVAADSWSPGPSLPEPRAGGGLVLLNSRLHYFGGSLADRRADSSSHWVLDLAEPRVWHPLAEMPGPRHQFGAAVLADRIYAIGGQENHDDWGHDLSRVDVYDPATDSWSSAAPLPRPRSHFEPGTFVWQDQICAAGGEVGIRQALYDIDCYDPSANLWATAPALPEPIRAPIVRPLNGSWYVATGGVMPSGMHPTTNVLRCEEPTYPLPAGRS